jgi:ABC-type bacteriocin/lantibiotic exporter with double-glycine peptidase domain
MAMVANHRCHKLDLTTLRNQYSVSFKVANMQQLMRLAEQLGMVGRALKLDLDDLKNLGINTRRDYLHALFVLLFGTCLSIGIISYSYFGN